VVGAVSAENLLQRALFFVREVESEERRRIAHGQPALFAEPLVLRAYEDLRAAVGVGVESEGS
jgi:hypothetical protein